MAEEPDGGAALNFGTPAALALCQLQLLAMRLSLDVELVGQQRFQS